LDQTAPSLPQDAWLRAPLGKLLRAGAGAAVAPLALATAAASLLALALPLVLLQVYDRILPSGGAGTLALLAAGAAAAILLEATLRMVRGTALARLAARAEAETHAAAMARISRASSAGFERQGNGWYAERFAAIASLRETWSGPALQALLDLPFGLLYLLAIWFLAGPLVLVPLAALAGLALLAWANGRRVRARSEALAGAEERRFNFLFDVLAGLQSLKLLGAEPLLERRYERLQGGSAEGRRRLADATASGTEGGLLLAQATAVATAAWGCLMVLDGTLTMGGLGACTMLAGRALQPLLGAAILWSRLQTIADQRRRVRELLDIPAEPRPGLALLRVPQGRVELRGVRFRPAPGAPLLFDGLSLSAAPGEAVGITGPNGAGHSSLLRLLSGEARPEAGLVLVDGQNLSLCDPASLRRHIALVPPGAAILGGTLLENLTLHDPELTDAALELAEALGLGAIAAGLAGGWHSPIGPGQAPLPQGVAQRVGLVRALARAPRVLLLDGVTDQLDSDGDARLTALLATLRGRVTVLHATHRPSALARCDRVVRLGGAA